MNYLLRAAAATVLVVVAYSSTAVQPPDARRDGPFPGCAPGSPCATSFSR